MSKSRGKFESLTGQTFGRWAVLERAENTYVGGARYRCRCSCGVEKVVCASTLRNGASESCGCLRSQLRREDPSVSHYSKDRPEYWMWKGAKSRAKRAGIPFNLDFEDIVIPSHCPLLGIPLERRKKSVWKGSPSLDRIVPSRGYVKGNVWVISHRANSMKSDFSVDQLKRFVQALEQKEKELDTKTTI